MNARETMLHKYIMFTWRRIHYCVPNVGIPLAGAVDMTPIVVFSVTTLREWAC
jgi:hypothetical protein